MKVPNIFAVLSAASLQFVIPSVANAEIDNILVASPTSSSVTVSWTTGDIADGCVLYGPSTTELDTVCDPREEGLLHFVELSDLLPESVYQYGVMSGAEVDTNQGSYYVLETTPIGVGIPYTLYGQIQPAPAWTLVWGTARKPSGETSHPIATLADSSGVWMLNLGNLRDLQTGEVFTHAAGDSIFLFSRHGPGPVTLDTVTVSGVSPQDCGVMYSDCCPGAVLADQKISDLEGGFEGILDDEDCFSASIVSIGDLDGNGVSDIAVGAHKDDDGGSNRGAVWVLFLSPEGTVLSEQKISATEGGFSGPLSNEDRFGISVASLGDLNGDGVGDIAVGAQDDDDGGSNRGAVWILFLASDGSVTGQSKISATQGSFGGDLANNDRFGCSLSFQKNHGDIPGGNLAVGAFRDDDGGTDRGAVWLLSIDSDGSVLEHTKISSESGGFSGALDDGDRFGASVGYLGDLNGSGIGDLAVGAHLDDDGGTDRGAVWILFLNADGTVAQHQKISATEGGFTGGLDDSDYFGRSVAPVHDIDGDAVDDLVIGASGDDDGGANQGAVWVLFLDTNGTVQGYQKISATNGNFSGELDQGDAFGVSVADLGNLDSHAAGDLAIGGHGDDDGGLSRGAVWILFLSGPMQGACCGLPAGECFLRTEAGCLEQSGDYLGDGVDCEPETCGYQSLPVGRPSKRQVWLSAPSPNPANQALSCSVTLAHSTHASLRIFDVTGKTVATLFEGHLQTGVHSFTWYPEARGPKLASGVYYLRLKTPGFGEAQRLVLIR